MVMERIFYYNVFMNSLRISYMHAMYLGHIHLHSFQIHSPTSSAPPNIMSIFLVTH